MELWFEGSHASYLSLHLLHLSSSIFSLNFRLLKELDVIGDTSSSLCHPSILSHFSASASRPS